MEHAPASRSEAVLAEAARAVRGRIVLAGGAVCAGERPVIPLTVVSGLYGAAKVNACNSYAPLAGTNTIALRGNDLSDRENVLNFHFGIPHKYDSGKDDIQILYDNFFYQTQAWDNLSTFGGLPFFRPTSLQSAGTNPDGTGNVQHVPR